MLKLPVIDPKCGGGPERDSRVMFLFERPGPYIFLRWHTPTTCRQSFTQVNVLWNTENPFSRGVNQHYLDAGVSVCLAFRSSFGETGIIFIKRISLPVGACMLISGSGRASGGMCDTSVRCPVLVLAVLVRCYPLRRLIRIYRSAQDG